MLMCCFSLIISTYLFRVYTNTFHGWLFCQYKVIQIMILHQINSKITWQEVVEARSCFLQRCPGSGHFHFHPLDNNHKKEDILLMYLIYEGIKGTPQALEKQTYEVSYNTKTILCCLPYPRNLVRRGHSRAPCGPVLHPSRTQGRTLMTARRLDAHEPLARLGPHLHSVAWSKTPK